MWCAIFRRSRSRRSACPLRYLVEGPTGRIARHVRCTVVTGSRFRAKAITAPIAKTNISKTPVSTKKKFAHALPPPFRWSCSPPIGRLANSRMRFSRRRSSSKAFSSPFMTSSDRRRRRASRRAASSPRARRVSSSVLIPLPPSGRPRASRSIGLPYTVAALEDPDSPLLLVPFAVPRVPPDGLVGFEVLRIPPRGLQLAPHFFGALVAHNALPSPRAAFAFMRPLSKAPKSSLSLVRHHPLCAPRVSPLR